MALVNKMFDIPKVAAFIVPTKYLNNTSIIIDSQSLVGIEVEVENVTELGAMGPMWEQKGDGSLRNNGVEFVSRPIPASQAPAALQDLMQNTLLASCCFSNRTSIHVHVDFSANDIADAYNTILLYSVFERLFYKFVGKRRIANIYCVPITETDMIRKASLKGFNPKLWQKYTGLNAVPLMQFGTLEFRHMHGTADVRKLSIWVDLITRLKDYCVKHGTKHIRTTIGTMDDMFDFRGLLIDIFGPSEQYLKYVDIDDVRLTYPIAKLGLCKKEPLTELAMNYSTNSKFTQVGRSN